MTSSLPYVCSVWKIGVSSYNIKYKSQDEQSFHNVVWDTECSPEQVALQMPGSIARGCAVASVATAGVSTQEWGSLCVWRRWVRTSWEAECRRPWVALSGLRAWPWVGPERGICEAWSTTLVERYQRIVYVQCVCVSDLWTPVPCQWRTYELVMGVGKGWNKRWVPCELRESSASFHDSGGSVISNQRLAVWWCLHLGQSLWWSAKFPSPIAQPITDARSSGLPLKLTSWVERCLLIGPRGVMVRSTPRWSK